MSSMLLLALLSGVGVAVALLLAVYFFFIRPEGEFRHRLLGLLFLAVGIRISKSVFYYMTGVPTIGVGIGCLGLASIGPTLWLYMKYSYNSNDKLSGIDMLHYLPGVFGLIAILISEGAFASIAYQGATSLLAIYLLFSWMSYLKEAYNSELQKWNRLVLVSITVVWIAFLYQLIADTILDYAFGAAIASLLFYVLFIYALRKPILFPRWNPIKVDQRVVDKLRNALENDKIYQRPSLTIVRIAEELGEPSYLISKALKAEYGKSFPELINHFRINEVKTKLSNQEDFVKIEGLAYEVGFNTPSAFYTAFKKETSLSPSEYKKTVIN